MGIEGSRRRVWRRLPKPRCWHRHHRSHFESVESLAESVRGAPDRFNQARMSGPRDCARRAAPAPNLDELQRLLSWGADTSIVGQRRTDATAHPGHRGRSRGRVRGSRRPAPSLRAPRRLTHPPLTSSATRAPDAARAQPAPSRTYSPTLAHILTAIQRNPKHADLISTEYSRRGSEQVRILFWRRTPFDTRR